ncbi:S16 family serine protease [Paenibacillus sp. KS-LC4]|uniref:PDZ domain-containing protein n=1 Tax=Paenibacillus sp. KS-LC4 TaxID=2979727 RepID=UPI0030D60BB6
MRRFRYYIAGLVLALLYIMAAELIWLPAPLKLPASGILWIDMINWLLYALAIIPLLWLAGGCRGIVERRKRSGGFAPVAAIRFERLLAVVQYGIAILGVSAILSIVIFPQRLMLSLPLIGGMLLIVCIEMAWSELLVRRSHSRRGGRLPKTFIGMLGSALAAAFVLVYPTDYIVTYPGLTMNMNRYAHVEGGAAGGSISGVLVFDRPAVPADWLYSLVLPEYTFERKPENEPSLSESYTLVSTMKADANSVAAAIAEGKAGIGAGVTTTGVRIVGMTKDSIAQGVLVPGDLIVSLNGKAVDNVMELTSYMEDPAFVTPGKPVQVTVQRGTLAEKLTLEVKTAAAAATDQWPVRAVFGISVQNELKLDAPRPVSYYSYIAHIGGPSHGAMLTLALLDQLTPGGVTHGLNVAGTGTIEPDGSVGLVGGVPQKAYAVSRTDADVFFVPEELAPEAKSAAPELRVVPVRTIDDILLWLQTHGKS